MQINSKQNACNFSKSKANKKTLEITHDNDISFEYISKENCYSVSSEINNI